MSRIVIFGSQGMLGNALCRYFSRFSSAVVPFTRAHFDAEIDEPSKLFDLCQGRKLGRGDYVINCAAILTHRLKDKSPLEIMRVNSWLPTALGHLCNASGARLIHISTDGVFLPSHGPCFENDFPDANDTYGISKLLGESPYALTIRTSILGQSLAQNGTSLIDWLLSQQNGASITGYTNQLWNGVTTVELAQLMQKIMQKDLWRPELVHVFAPQPLSKFELLQNVVRIYGLNLQVVPGEAKIAVTRTLNSRKSTDFTVTKSLPEQITELHRFYS